jgi:hypothetical protein
MKSEYISYFNISIFQYFVIIQAIISLPKSIQTTIQTIMLYGNFGNFGKDNGALMSSSIRVYIRPYMIIVTTWFGLLFGHYMAAHLYTRFCTPWTWFGFVTSPFMTMSPHCTALRWCISNGATHINNLWISMGAWASLQLLHQIQSQFTLKEKM